MRDLFRQAQQRFATAAAFAIHQGQGTAVRFRDLPAQSQPDSRTARLRGEERHEEIGRVHDALPFVLHVKLDAIRNLAPANDDPAARFKRSIHRVVQNIDQQLLELRRVRANRNIGACALFTGRRVSRSAIRLTSSSS